MDDLVRSLRNAGALQSEPILKAFTRVDRADFVLPEYRSAAYEDRPIPIGFGQTISQPTTVAFMLEQLCPARGQRILDVGAGSGWTTALLAMIVGRSGTVVGKEIIPELAQQAEVNLRPYALTHASVEYALKGQLGDPGKAPFDRILVSASARKYPKELEEQLRIGGIMVLPIRHEIWKVVRTDKHTSEITKFPGFIFVPLK